VEQYYDANWTLEIENKLQNLTENVKIYIKLRKFIQSLPKL